MALQILDSKTQTQRALTSAEQAEVRSGLGLGTAATTAATAYATAAQGVKADTALQPGVIPSGTTIPLAQVSGAGTAAAAAVADFATAVQGVKADTAVQAAGMPAAMVDGYQAMTPTQKQDFSGVSYASTQPSASVYVWWVSPLDEVWNSNGSVWTKIV